MIGSLLMKKRTISGLFSWLVLAACFSTLMTATTPSGATDEAKASSLVKPLGPANLGSDLWSAVRARSDAASDQYGLSRDTKRNKTTQVRGYDANVLVNQAGDTWASFRNHQMMPKGRDLMIFVLLLMFLFYVFRGSVDDDTDESGIELQRFSISARMIHWFLAGLFILLGITGLILLYGRTMLIPLVGHEAFGVIAGLSKELHNLSGPLFPIDSAYPLCICLCYGSEAALSSVLLGPCFPWTLRTPSAYASVMDPKAPPSVNSWASISHSPWLPHILCIYLCDGSETAPFSVLLGFCFP